MRCRRLLCVMLCLALLFGLAACGGSGAVSKGAKKQNTVEDVLQAGMDAYDGQKNAADNAAPADNTANQTQVDNTTNPADNTAAPDISGTADNSDSAADDFTETGVIEHVADPNGIFDLTQVSGNMLFAEIFNMLMAPAEYMGERIRMAGTMFYGLDDAGNTYYGCFMKDAMGCCSQGFEFELKEGKYPEENTPITIVGTFDVYEENEQTYCILRDTVIEN